MWELHRGVMYLRSLSQIHPSLHLTVQFFFEAVVLCHELLDLILFEEKYTDMKMFAKFQQGKKTRKEKINGTRMLWIFRTFGILAFGHCLTDNVSDSISVLLRVCISFSWDCLSSEKVKSGYINEWEVKLLAFKI